ncbi:MAG: hypothetical protein IJ761_00150 [Bacteroidales bacterium]|nr:hypothetical protein [Bacteroidales bacterium]
MTPIDTPMQNMLALANQAPPIGGAAGASAALGPASLLPLALNLLNNVTSFASQERTNRQNQLLAQQQNQWNIDQWNRANAYNTPTAQMARLKAAGINPALAYANGNVQNLGTDSPTAAEVRYDPMQMSMLDPLTLSEVKKNDAETESILHETKREDDKHEFTLDNLKAQTDKLRKEVDHMSHEEQMQFISVSLDAARLELDNRRLDEEVKLWNSQIAKNNSELALNQQQYNKVLLLFDFEYENMRLTNEEIKSRMKVNDEEVKRLREATDYLKKQAGYLEHKDEFENSEDYQKAVKKSLTSAADLADKQAEYWKDYKEHPEKYRSKTETTTTSSSENFGYGGSSHGTSKTTSHTVTN